MFWSTLLLPLLAAPACLAAPSKETRAAITDGTLYAYGKHISGLPVFYNTAGSTIFTSSSNASSLVPVTWNIPAMSTATTETTAATLPNGTTAGELFIDTSGNEFDEILIVGSATSGSMQVTGGTTGFTTYGTQLVYYNGSSIQSAFWAKEVTQTDGSVAFSLHWNWYNEDISGAVPVVLKALAPSTTAV
ncbi:unnamed protein product [Discula destructiva]